MATEMTRESAREQVAESALAQFDAELEAQFATELAELGTPWQAAKPQSPQLIVLNTELATELGLDAQQLSTNEGTRFLLGNALARGSQPVAQVYAGHQFGGYSPRLGDGRALLLGEIRDPQGTLRDLHLKGSGRTPFARGGDGFASVGPMLREVLVSEAMDAFGIPTTRALAVVATGELVPREDGPRPGALLARVASSHLRVGTFQYVAATGDEDLLRRLVDFAIARHYPELDDRGAEDGAEGGAKDADAAGRALGLLEAVISAQARLIAQWMQVGFVHGVMNTDNMTISGETIDYGPCAFIDNYDLSAVYSSIDRGGRYAYGNQPSIALWNLTRLAETLLPLLSDDPKVAEERAVTALRKFEPQYQAAWLQGMRAKLGFAEDRTGIDPEALARIVQALLDDLRDADIDYTLGMRALAASAERREEAGLPELFPEGSLPGEWFMEWLEMGPDPELIRAVSPVVIPRNELVDEALSAAEAGDLAPFERILDAVSRPYEARLGYERYAAPAGDGQSRHVTFCGT